MAPDLNSLPPSRSTTTSPLSSRNMQSSQPSNTRQDTPSPRGSMSLAATATMNAADRSRRSSSSYQNRGSPQLNRMSSERRRSQIAASLNLNDPGIPGPGELSSPDHRSSMSHSFAAASPHSLGGRGTIATGDPHHQRQPSLGDIHNELEQEQEAQVNRMLQMIRTQQHQLEALQRSQQEANSGSTTHDGVASNTTAAIVDESTPVSERSFSLGSRPALLSRHSSSATRSPGLRPLPGQDTSGSTGDYFTSSPVNSTRRNSIRDETAFYQAETASLTRENQMLRHRIRELEKQLGELTAKPANSPSTPSNLATSPPLRGQDGLPIPEDI